MNDLFRKCSFLATKLEKDDFFFFFQLPQILGHICNIFLFSKSVVKFKKQVPHMFISRVLATVARYHQFCLFRTTPIYLSAGSDGKIVLRCVSLNIIIILSVVVWGKFLKVKRDQISNM